MKVSYNFNDLFGSQKPPVKEPSGEILDFENTFDTHSLRMFYKERESFISQTTLYTQNEESLFEDLDLDRQNFLSTPLSRVLSNSNCDNFTTLDPYRRASYNSSANVDIQIPPSDFPILQENNFGAFGAENQGAPQLHKRVSEGMQISMKNGNMFFNTNGLETAQRNKSENHAIFSLVRTINFDQKKPQEAVAQSTPVVRNQMIKNMEDEESAFFKNLRAKKIFKVQRSAKSEKIENLKKKASSPKTKSKADKPLQVIRSQSAHGSSIVFNFSSGAGRKNSP